MEIRRMVDIEGLPATRSLAYANAVVAGDLIFVAGQAGTDESGRVVSPDFEAQTRRTFENIGVALAAAGSDLSRILTMTVFITDWRYGPEFIRVRGELLGENLAASATIGIGQLAVPDMLVEVQCTAAKAS
ncbi:MAG TPA: RidA family protein [Acidimicrobiales bacterium]|nr:RidA family protein [Acidimicrobiales bacterium]